MSEQRSRPLWHELAKSQQPWGGVVPPKGPNAEEHGLSHIRPWRRWEAGPDALPFEVGVRPLSGRRMCRSC